MIALARIAKTQACNMPYVIVICKLYCQCFLIQVALDWRYGMSNVHVECPAYGIRPDSASTNATRPNIHRDWSPQHVE